MRTIVRASFAVALLLAFNWEARGQNSVGEMEAAYVKALPDGPGKAAMVRATCVPDPAACLPAALIVRGWPVPS